MSVALRERADTPQDPEEGRAKVSKPFVGAPAPRVTAQPALSGAPRVDSATDGRSFFGSQGARVDRSSGGRFVPAGGAQLAGHALRLGPVRVGNLGQFSAPPSYGVPEAEETAQPPAQDFVPDVVRGEAAPDVRAPRGRAWGLLKKQDAAELAAYLKEVEAGMVAQQVPPGIVREIRRKVDQFLATAPENAELEIPEAQLEELDVVIAQYEEVEGQGRRKTILTVGALGLVGVGVLALTVF